MKIVNKFGMMSATVIVCASTMMSSCKKEPEISPEHIIGGVEVSDAAPLTGSVKGTMKSGKTYYLNGEVTINQGDTLFLEAGVKVYAKSAASAFIIKGVFVSAGTKESPNVIGFEGKTREGDVNPETAMDGLWGGLICDASCPLLAVKWTSLEYTGSHFINAPIEGLSAKNYYWGITFQNPDGILIVEDSWIYGVNTEGIRVTGGKVSIMRNTIEKMGQELGDALALKGGVIGNVAYNVLIGCSSHGIIVDNGLAATQCRINAYNNTIVNSGWRTARDNEIYAICFHKGAAGKAFNNAIINCRAGLFLSNTNPPNMQAFTHGNNYFYGNTKDIAEGFYPAGGLGVPAATDIPALSSYGAIAEDGSYDGTDLVAKNAPLFVSFVLPGAKEPKDIAYSKGFNFALQASSPLTGKGTTTAVDVIDAVPVHELFGATEVTRPGSDIGAYQSNGTGNKH
jgi:hypothetical protein